MVQCPSGIAPYEGGILFTPAVTAMAGRSARQIKQQAKKNRCHQQRFLVTIKSNQRWYTASITHSAVMLTMRRTVADGVRMCAGLAQPSSTGPIAMPLPAVVLSRL